MNRRLRASLITFAFSFCCLSPASALANSVTATTNGGGSCQIQTSPSRSGPMTTLSIQVQPCAAHFGVRYAKGLGLVTDTAKGTQDGYMPATQGPVPYANSAMLITPLLNAMDPYSARADVSVVLNSGVLSRRAVQTTRECSSRDAEDDNGETDNDRGFVRVCRNHRFVLLYTKFEKWRDPGAKCVVTTTFHAGDTLGCQLLDPLP